MEEQHPWYEQIMLGMVKASAKAVDLARETNTKLAVWLDNKVVEMTPDEWQAYQAKQINKKESIDGVSR